jgi:hypothetical protein
VKLAEYLIAVRCTVFMALPYQFVHHVESDAPFGNRCSISTAGDGSLS